MLSASEFSETATSLGGLEIGLISVGFFISFLWTGFFCPAAANSFLGKNVCKASCYLDSLVPCCPKRKARYLKKIKKRKMYRDCPLQRFMKLHLPPPLPYREPCKTKKASALDVKPQGEEEAKPRIQKVVIRPPPTHLTDLVRFQNWEAIRKLKIREEQASHQDSDGLLPLHWAVSSGAPPDVVEKLLTSNPQAVFVKDSEGSLPLHFAAHYAARNIIHCVLQAYPEAVFAQDKYGRTPLYHGTDKNLGIQSLEALSPTAELPKLPCCAPKGSSERERAIRTPLYLVWGKVLLNKDPNTKQLAKAIWMLNHAAEDDSNVVTNAIQLDVYLPDQVVPFLVNKFSDLLRIPKYPLLTAAASKSYSEVRYRTILSVLLTAFPAAARYRDPETGASVLSEAIRTGHCNIDILLKAVPASLHWTYKGMNMMALAASSKPISYEKNTLSARQMDPYNLLGKHRQLLPKPVVLEASADEHKQLDLVFQITRADPAQLLR